MRCDKDGLGYLELGEIIVREESFQFEIMKFATPLHLFQSMTLKLICCTNINHESRSSGVRFCDPDCRAA
jgi:hypothetical protein